MNLVKKSLYLCLGVLLGLLVLQGAQSLWQVSRLAAATDAVVAGGRLQARAQQLWTRFLAAERELQTLTAFTDAASADALRKSFAGASAALRGDLDALDAAAAGEHASDTREASAAVSRLVKAWLALADRHAGTEGQTELPSYHVLEAARADVDAAIGGLVAGSAASAAASVDTSHALAREAVVWTVVKVVFALVLGTALGWHALRSLHRQLGADAGEVARVAQAVAGGDLRVAIPTEHLPPASVMAAIGRMQQALLGTVSHVSGISAQLATGSDEIASGNAELSRRTEEQAAALERTASTMEQLGTTVRHNADNAGQASQLADHASDVARRGGTVVEQAVETMRGINDSSRRIADIIGVIDGIAFQTNILALNAAVEAARAGEQGRGFAVVAGEVRSLAQRSAEAAKEIKALISASVERVEAGSTLVDQAGGTMQEVVQAIERVTSVMAEIRTATHQQSAGVAQVGQAVSDLDRATQRNAGLAVQSAAAAEGLKSQGQLLVQAMAFFKVSGEPATAGA